MQALSAEDRDLTKSLADFHKNGIPIEILKQTGGRYVALTTQAIVFLRQPP